MTVHKNPRWKSNLLPITVIAAATVGDPEALDTVLKHYRPYIRALCTKQLYDTSGTQRRCVDEDLMRQLENKLIAGILRFCMD